jgi:hypothetical protein
MKDVQILNIFRRPVAPHRQQNEELKNSPQNPLNDTPTQASFVVHDVFQKQKIPPPPTHAHGWEFSPMRIFKNRRRLGNRWRQGSINGPVMWPTLPKCVKCQTLREQVLIVRNVRNATGRLPEDSFPRRTPRRKGRCFA